MKTYIHKICYIIALVLFTNNASALSLLEGKWKIIDTIGNEKMVVKIYQTSIGTLSAKIIKNKTMQKNCKKCKGRLKNKPIQGMVILSNLTQVPGNPRAYNKGKFINLSSGKIHKADVKIDNGGLYVDIKGSSHNQLWKRID